jgi:hypothetical protein
MQKLVLMSTDVSNFISGIKRLRCFPAASPATSATGG